MALEPGPARQPRSVRVCPSRSGPECAGGCSVLCPALVPVALKQNQRPSWLPCLLALWHLHQASHPGHSQRALATLPVKQPLRAPRPVRGSGRWRSAGHPSVDSRLDVGLGSWPWQTLVLVSKHCSLQVGVLEKAVTGLKHPSPGPS